MPDLELAIGPANYAGQATQWALAVRRTGLARAWSFSNVPRFVEDFSFQADRMMGKFEYRNPIFRAARARGFLGSATHVALDGFKSFFHVRQRGKFPGDVRSLLDSGFHVALISHGSDTRSPEAHMARERFSYYREGSDAWRSGLSEASARSRAFAEECGLPVFYSTPDLGFDLPFGTWLPVCLDLDAWYSPRPLLEARRPRVLHIPSRRNPPIKGSRYIEPVLEELDAAGVIEHVGPAAVPPSEMPLLVQSCDIVVDQILSGYYGVAAVEAMAAGRVIIGNLSDDVRARMVEAPGILDARPHNLRQVILRAVEDRQAMRDLADANLAFVRRWHDGTESSRRLLEFMASTGEPGR